MSLLSLLSTMLIAQVATDGGPAQVAPAPREPPAWVVEGVPDTVWILVEETYADVDDDLAYAIERELGEGGMATVYLADDIKHERKVALKVLKPII